MDLIKGEGKKIPGITPLCKVLEMTKRIRLEMKDQT